MVDFKKPLFDVGQCVATPAVMEIVNELGIDLSTYLDRHIAGDWGDCDEGDRQANEDALENGGRIFSICRLEYGTKIWIITSATGDEGHRESTTVMLPEEY